MTMYDVAAAVLAVVTLGWWAVKYFKGEDPNDKIKGVANQGKETFVWLNLDLINGLSINPMLFLLWFGGNILFGNLVALMAGVEWLNTLNAEALVTFPYFALMIFSMAPSFIQWWIESTPPGEDEREINWIYWGGWIFVGIDVFLCVAGYWSYWQMPTDFSLLTSGHLAALAIFVAIAIFCNVYCESALHQTLEELHFTLTGQKREKPKKKEGKPKKKEKKKKKEEEELPTNKQVLAYLAKLSKEES